MANLSDALVLWDTFGATADVLGNFSEQEDLSVTGLLQYWQYQILGLRKDILEFDVHNIIRDSRRRQPYNELNIPHTVGITFETISYMLEDITDEDVNASRILECICTGRQKCIRSILDECKIQHPEANNRVLCFTETALLVAYSIETSNQLARTVIQTTRISQVVKDIIEADSQVVITSIRLNEKIVSTAGKAEKAVQCIARAAAASVSLTLGSRPIVYPESPGPEKLPPEKITQSSKKNWIRLCRMALHRYRSSACLSTSAIKSFIVHLQDGGDEGGTAPLVLKEDYDDSPFELGPSSTIRRVYSSGDVVLEWGDGLKATISEKDRMIEAEARGLFDRETSLNLLQATLHDLIIDSTDAITSIQYLDGLEAHDYSDRPSWENSKVGFCQRFLSSFMPSGSWDDCTARHALRDKRRPGLHFDFYLQTTLKSIRASLLQRRQAQLQWRWSAHNSCTFGGETLIAGGYYLDTIVLVGKVIYIAERVTHGTSVVHQEIWKTAPWRPLEPRVSLIAVEDELDRLNDKLSKLQQSSRWHRNLVTSKSVGLPLVAFASAVAAIGNIVAATGPVQVGLAVLGLTAAVVAFLLSFLEDAIRWQLKQTAGKIADATQASTRYEGASGDKVWLENV